MDMLQEKKRLLLKKAEYHDDFPVHCCKNFKPKQTPKHKQVEGSPTFTKKQSQRILDICISNVSLPPWGTAFSLRLTWAQPKEFQINLVWKGRRSQATERMKLFCNCFWEYVGPHSEILLWNICVSAKFLARAETFSHFPTAENREGGKKLFS